MAKPRIYLVRSTVWCCSASDYGYSLNRYGPTPQEAYKSWLRAEVKMDIARAKAFSQTTGKVTINVNEVFEESHRVVMAEFTRIGKKVLPVILALVVGVAIGVAHG